MLFESFSQNSWRGYIGLILFAILISISILLFISFIKSADKNKEHQVIDSCPLLILLALWMISAFLFVAYLLTYMFFYLFGRFRS